MQLALLDPHLGNVDVEVAERVALELSLACLLRIRQAADAMALQAAMQRRPRRVRHVVSCRA